MAMSGVKVEEEVKTSLLSFKKDKKRFIAVQIADDEKTFCLDKELNCESKELPQDVDEDLEKEDYNAFRSKLKTCQKPHLVHYKVRSKKGDKYTDKIVTMNWCLDKFNVKAKMLHSSSEKAIKTSVEMGNDVIINIRDEDDCPYEEVLNTVLKKK